ncbi:master DNA invertase Mpi family serine-type recombinase [Helicobacter cappadocius]|uniref:Master DNA invertase Mpi family serine-type recombinase n=1 Tax=Helicobacter cappadocius TaxID=3063998 RepID=A0AA90PSX9_9HELI|nr:MULTISPECIES: master DNA invertase Mpi family serine-type recombinase [unclassified Helicobacter]MDO7253720.1 master DNA invertase Mpi family serine-type recombinase [Helicobacter sp. faydin-H75]MDP2539592.1 master DNA invertase Mpi family serine-type recombinase [Helicobacter sp. faydin-H76]
MIYAYIRVSTDKQTTENQRFEIENFAKSKDFKINNIVEETKSGMIAIDNRKLGRLIKSLKKGDTLIVTELSRLGRSLLAVMGLLNECMSRGITIYSIKERYELGDNINSKVLAFAFSLSAEIERQLISQRTKEGLARRRAEGVILGRRKGSKSRIECHPCYEARDKILEWDAKGYSHSYIAKKLGVHRDTLRRWFIKSGNGHLLKGRNYDNVKNI